MVFEVNTNKGKRKTDGKSRSPRGDRAIEVDEDLLGTPGAPGISDSSLGERELVPASQALLFPAKASGPPPVGPIDVSGSASSEVAMSKSMAELFEKNFAATSESFAQDIKGQISESIADNTRTLVKGVISESITGLDSRITKVDSKVDKLDESLATVLQKLAIVEENQKLLMSKDDSKPTPSSFAWPPASSHQAPRPGVFADGSGVGVLLGNGGFFRAPDSFKLFANVEGGVKVSGLKFSTAFETLAFEAGIKSDLFIIKGEELDNTFEIVFQGSDPAILTKQFLCSLQIAPGQYKTMVCQSSESVLSDGMVKFFVNPDKNPAQVRKEVLTRKMQIILGNFTQEAVSCSRVLGRCFISKRRVVSVIIKDEDSFILDWDKGQCNLQRLEFPKIEVAFRASVGMPSL